MNTNVDALELPSPNKLPVNIRQCLNATLCLFLFGSFICFDVYGSPLSPSISGMSTIHLSRILSDRRGAFLPKVYIDGVFVGGLEESASLDISVPMGIHSVTVESEPGVRKSTYIRTESSDATYLKVVSKYTGSFAPLGPIYEFSIHKAKKREN